MKLWIPLAAASWLLLLAGPMAAQAASAHEHGLARIDIAVDAGRLDIVLDTPLDNLLGFERAPRNDAERQQADAAVAALKAGARLFVIDRLAACALTGVELKSAVLKLGLAAAGSAAEHADMEASWTFTCKGPAPAHVDVALFGAFKRLGRIEVQAATPKGQSRTTLKRPAQRVPLPR